MWYPASGVDDSLQIASDGIRGVLVMYAGHPPIRR